MFSTVKTMVISALLGASALSLVPASAQADNLYFSLGIGDRRGNVIYDDRYAPAGDWRQPGWDRPPPQWDRRRPRDWAESDCAPRTALRKAYRMGLDRPFIARDNRRMIVIGGVGDRGREWISFARVPGCPVIR
jgi:hypothetical protein